MMQPRQPDTALPRRDRGGAAMFRPDARPHAAGPAPRTLLYPLAPEAGP